MKYCKIFCSRDTSNFFPISFIFLLAINLIIISGCSMLESSAGDENKLDVGSTETSEEVNIEESEKQLDEEKDAAKEDINEDANEVENKDETGNVSEASSEITNELTIKVYYADKQGEYLIPEWRTIGILDTEGGSNKYIDALKELIKSPTDDSLIRIVPETTVINSVAVNDKIAEVDLSESFMTDRFVSDTADILLIYSIVNTLTEFPEIHAVTLFIDGKKVDIFGQLDIKDPIYRDETKIKP